MHGTPGHASNGQSCGGLLQGIPHEVRPLREAERHARGVGSKRSRVGRSALDILRVKVRPLLKVRYFARVANPKVGAMSVAFQETGLARGPRKGEVVSRSAEAPILAGTTQQPMSGTHANACDGIDFVR